MNLTQQQLTLIKVAVVLLVVAGGFGLVFAGKLDAASMFKDVNDTAAGLVVALGISAGGAAVASKMRGPLVAFALLAFTTVASSACSSAQTTQGTVAGVDLALCILDHVSAGVAAKEPWQQVAADTAKACGTDAATVANVWASHVHAESVEGLNSRMPVPSADGGR